MLIGWDLQACGKERRDLTRRLAKAGLDLVDGVNRAANRVRDGLLSEIKLAAALFKPLGETGCGLHAHLPNQA
jgi:hypothetical protein